MNLAPSKEQAALAGSAAEFLAKELPIGRLREFADDVEGDSIDERTWRRCADLGWLGLGIPEAHGGVGLGLAEEALLFRELGRHLAPGPFRSCVLGAHVAVLSGHSDLAAAICAGERRVGMQVGNVAVDVRPGDLMLVLDEDGAQLREATDVRQVRGVDPGTRFATVSPGPIAARVTSSAVMDRARVLAAAEQLGIIEAVRDASAEYARTRTQFGKPIGSFQAVKHRCADMAIAGFAVVGELFQAALLVEAGTPDASFHAANAYVLATGGARASTADNIQNHGGMGFTWEQDAHLYLKRALLLERLLGPQRLAHKAILGPPVHEF